MIAPASQKVHAYLRLFFVNRKDRKATGVDDRVSHRRSMGERDERKWGIARGSLKTEFKNQAKTLQQSLECPELARRGRAATILPHSLL